MFLVIDGGTTNLRVTLLDEKQKPVDAVMRTAASAIRLLTEIITI